MRQQPTHTLFLLWGLFALNLTLLSPTSAQTPTKKTNPTPTQVASKAPPNIAPISRLNRRHKKVIVGIQNFYRNLQDLRTEFTQVFSAARLSRKQREAGRFFYRKPSMMRFQYRKPEPKDFIYNGNTLWMYYPEDEEVKVRKNIQRSQLGIAFQFLWGSGDLDKSFRIRRLKRCQFRLGKRRFRFGNKGDICLALSPRKRQTLFKKLYFGVIPTTYQIREVLYVDRANNCNHFRFASMKLNNKLPATLFQFKAPQGTEVIQLR